MVFVPADKLAMFSVATPPFNVPTPSVVVPSLNVTTPDGTPAPGLTGLSVAVNVTL